jgi:1,4-dihydroxy-2-naphthoyl-CoA hydrolase
MVKFNFQTSNLTHLTQLFPSGINLDEINRWTANTMIDHLGIRLIEAGPDYLKAEMPVDQRTIQPYGYLNGGASAALAENLGSIAANLLLSKTNKIGVGLEINANHLRSVKLGSIVFGVARPLHLGNSTQVWEVRISNESDQLVCISRLTVAVVEKKV